MQPFSSYNDAVIHWNNFFLEQETTLLQIEPFAKVTKEKIETLFVSYQKQLNKHILFAQAAYGYHSLELAQALQQRLQGMRYYIDILKNYLLHANTIPPTTEEKEQLLNTLNQQALTELAQIGLENPEYKNWADEFYLHMDFNYSPENFVDLAKKIKAGLSESDLQTKPALRLILNVIFLVDQKMRRAEPWIAPDLKNKLPFLRRELAIAEMAGQFFSRKISLLAQSYHEFTQKEQEFQEKTVCIQHFKYPFCSLIGEARRQLAITYWNNMIGLADKIFIACNLPDNTGSLEYKNWPNLTKYFLVTTLTPVLNAYRESDNDIESIFELIPEQSPSLLHESNRQRLEEILSEIEETLKIFQSLVPFIKQIISKKEDPEQLINKFAIWIKKKQPVINQYFNLPAFSQTIEQHDLDLELFLFKYDFFAPEIDFLEQRILNSNPDFSEIKALLPCYQEQINKHIAFVEDPNLVSRGLLKTVLTQRQEKITAYVKLLEILSIRPEQNLMAYFTDSAQKEIESIQDYYLHQPNHYFSLKKGLYTLAKIRKIDKRALNIKECLSELQAVKALGAEQGMNGVTLDQFIDALEHIMLEIKPTHLAALSTMNRNLLQKEYLLFYLQRKELLDLSQVIDPSAHHEESQINSISTQLFGKTAPPMFHALSQHAHQKESELRTQLGEFTAQPGREYPKISVEKLHHASSLNITTLHAPNTQQQKPILHAAPAERDPRSIYPHQSLARSNYRLFSPPSRKRKSSAELPEDEHIRVKRLRPNC